VSKVCLFGVVQLSTTLEGKSHTISVSTGWVCLKSEAVSCVQAGFLVSTGWVCLVLFG
jgi:hypothetical protein